MAAPKQPPQPNKRTGGTSTNNDKMPTSIVQSAIPGQSSSGIDTSGSQVNPTTGTGPKGWAATQGGAGQRPIPQMEQQNPERPDLTILGAAGTSFFGGLIQNTGEYNPELHWRDWIEKVSQMLRSDVQLRALQELLTNTLLAAKWSITPGDDSPVAAEIASFVETCLMHDIRYTTEAGITVAQSWSSILRHVLLMVPYGFSPLEVCWRQEDDGEGGYWLKIAKLQPLLPQTVYKWWVGRDVELEGIQTWAYKDYSYRFTDIPASKLLLFVHDQQGQNYEGLSALRPAFQAWFYKQQFLKIAAIAVERNGIEIPVITLEPNATQASANQALKIGQNMRAGTQPAAVLANEWKLEYPRLSQNHAATVLPWVQYFDVLMGRAYHAPWVNLGSTEVGAYNLDASQKRTTLMAWQAIPDTEIAPLFQPLIEQLVRLNYGEQDVYPCLECANLMASDVTVLADALQSLGSYLPPSQTVNDFVADAVGVPKAPVNPVEATNPTGPNDGTDGAGDGGFQNRDSADDGTQDAGDSSSSSSDGGGDSGGASMAERLLAEALDALNGADAVERGETWLGGHPQGYTQNRNRGKFAPGDGGEHIHESSGGGRGKGEGEGEKVGRGGGGGGGGGGSGGKGKSKQTPAERLNNERRANRLEHAILRKSGMSNDEIRAQRAAGAKEASKVAGHREAEALHRAAVEGRSGGGAKGAKGAGGKAPAEGIHEKSARLQREGGLKAEVKPGEKLTVLHHDEMHQINIAAKVNARKFLAVYGEHQLGAAMAQFKGQDKMEEFAKSAGIEPVRTRAGNISRTKTISAVTAHLTEGRYSANFGSHAAEGSTRGGKSAATAKPAAETIHERAARLQREGGLKAEAKPDPVGKGQSKALVTNLEKVGEGRFTLDPSARVEPSEIVKAYGEHQLGKVLDLYPKGKIDDTAAALGVSRGRSRADTISRITSHVTEGRYSANFGASAGAKGGGKASKSGSEPQTRREQLLNQTYKTLTSAQRRNVARLTNLYQKAIDAGRHGSSSAEVQRLFGQYDSAMRTVAEKDALVHKYVFEKHYAGFGQ